MEGFTPLTPATLYSKGRGYGLKDARIWRAFDALQPDPLYQDFICIESGGLAVDVPNGKYRVFVNIDNPSGFWGEYQSYRKRAILAEGRPVVTRHHGLRRLQARSTSASGTSRTCPADNTFDKYQKPYFSEKQFDVDVTDGQLNSTSRARTGPAASRPWSSSRSRRPPRASSSSTTPGPKRRFHFDNYFKRILHVADRRSARRRPRTTARAALSSFSRDRMQDVYYNDTPRPARWREARARRGVRGRARAGDALASCRWRDLGQVTVDGQRPARARRRRSPPSAIDVGFVSYRLSRVTMEGIGLHDQPAADHADRHGRPAQGRDPPVLADGQDAGGRAGRASTRATVVAPDARARTAGDVPLEFTCLPRDARPGRHPGRAVGLHDRHPLVRRRSRGRRRGTERWPRSRLRKMREYGFTTFSGAAGRSTTAASRTASPCSTSRPADAQMKMAREAGLHMPVITYGSGVSGFNAYYQGHRRDEARRASAITASSSRRSSPPSRSTPTRPAGCRSTGTSATSRSATNLTRAAENAEAYRKAFPKGPPFFTGAPAASAATDANDPHFRLSKALHVADWNGHDEAAVRLLHEAGGDWAFYNGGNRWTFGVYMYKAAKQFGMKFRVSWHWNVVGRRPLLRPRLPRGRLRLVQLLARRRRSSRAVQFERLRPGLDDYRAMLTLARLRRKTPATARGGGNKAHQRPPRMALPPRPARPRRASSRHRTGRNFDGRLMRRSKG